MQVRHCRLINQLTYSVSVGLPAGTLCVDEGVVAEFANMNCHRYLASGYSAPATASISIALQSRWMPIDTVCGNLNANVEGYTYCIFSLSVLFDCLSCVIMRTLTCCLGTVAHFIFDIGWVLRERVNALFFSFAMVRL